jgi:cob(I)alamin adenosyltransferase
MSENEKALLFAAQNILWKLGHNFSLPDYKGPARIDRKDATVRMLEDAVNKYGVPGISL